MGVFPSYSPESQAKFRGYQTGKHGNFTGYRFSYFGALNLLKKEWFRRQTLNAMEELASGNLAKRVNGFGEYSAVADSVTTINKNTKTILSETCGMAQMITALSDDLNETIRQEEMATNQIAVSIH